MTKLQKGSAAFRVCIHSKRGVATATIWPIQIQSMGAKQGTATTTEDGQLLRIRLYRHEDGTILTGWGGWVVATREDVEALIAEKALPIAEQNLRGELNCERVNFPNLWPKYRAGAEASIKELEATTPSVVVDWR